MSKADEGAFPLLTLCGLSRPGATANSPLRGQHPANWKMGTVAYRSDALGRRNAAGHPGRTDPGRGNPVRKLRFPPFRPDTTPGSTSACCP